MIKFLFEEKNQKYNIDYIDLNLFGESDVDERTEDPTAHQERKAREEGKVARSQDLSSSILLLGSFLYFFIFGQFLYKDLKFLFIDSFNFSKYHFQNKDILITIIESLKNFLFLIGPFMFLLMIIGLISSFSQVGFVFSLKPLKLNWKKVSFSNNPISKIFFSKHTLFNLFKSAIKIIVIFSFAYIFISLNKEKIFKSIYLDLESSLRFFITITHYFGFTIIFVFLILSIPDFFYQKKKFKDSIKMTKHQVKQERKELEGDVQLKQRVREKQREILRNTYIKEIKKANVLITNPTHYSIAIKYDMNTMDVPIVVAKGKGYVALRMRELAKEYEISIVENKVLAPILYKEVNIGDQVPERFYQVIAEILAFIMRSKENMKIK